MKPNLENKVAVVTGGSRGIGFRIAEALLEQGACVVIGSRQEDSLRQARETLRQLAPSRVEATVADVRNYDQVEQLMALAETKFGGIDILVNNAGIGLLRPVEQMTPEEWDAVIDTNLTGCFYCVRAVVPRMKRRGGGYIFNISSLAGKNAFAGGAAYNASKFGLNGFSEAVMLDLRYDNIRVSYILPGSVETAFGQSSGEPGRTSGWKLDARDVAQVVLDLLVMDPRGMVSRVEMRPSQPPRK
ncbi:MAG: SDR family oxidoreductase [Acidobacteria bacterium]|nr:SDR family oxidoreductase [Acidobacteriota bacterium]